MCECNVPVKISTSTTIENPGRKFIGCSGYKTSSKCNVFYWIDELEKKITIPRNFG